MIPEPIDPISEMVYDYIQKHEPCAIYHITENMGLTHNQVVNAMMRMENAGFLLWQDGRTVGVFRLQTIEESCWNV